MALQSPAKSNPETRTSITWPTPPKLFPVKSQEEFEQWYYALCQAIQRQADEMQARIDRINH